MSAKKKEVRAKFQRETFERDGHACIVCGRKGVKLDAHHVTDRNDMPNGGYVKENGATLCAEPDPANGHASCHEKAELFHTSHGTAWIPGLHPDELYKKIGSSKEQAVRASERLSS